MSDDPPVEDERPTKRSPGKQRRISISGAHANEIEAVRVNVSAEFADDIERIKLRDRLTENSWRRWAIGFLLLAFVALNAAVLGFLYIIWRGEIGQTQATHIVTEHVMLALIAGSVAQLGALALSLGGALARQEV